MVEVVHVLCDLAGGGAERLVLDLCRFAAPDIRPRVVTVHEGGALTRAFAQAGVRVQSAGRQRGRLGLRAVGALARAMGGADLIHTHLWAGDTWGRIAALARPGVPLVRTEHNVAADSGRWRDWVSGALAGRTTCAVGVSPAAAAHARSARIRERDLRVIENGVDLERFPPLDPAPRRPGEPLAVLGVGRLVPQKGFDLLIQAAAGLPVRLTLVGEGPEAAALAALARGLGVALVTPGWISDLRPHLEAAHVVAIPSRWEGFGLVAVEAMASRRAILASEAPPLPSLIGAAGRCVPLGPPAAMRSALEAMLQASLRESMASVGPTRAARWSVRHTVEAYESLYRDLVDHPRDGA